MKSTKDLLHQIHDPNLSTDERAHLRCQLAKQLEEVGNYETAREAMGDLWGNIGDPPNLEDLDQPTAAEVLLRVGTLTGWLGSTNQIEGTQQAAKDLISESIRIFDSLHDIKKVAEAQIEIATCYRREGALDEARIWFAEALSRLDDHDGDLKAVALLRTGNLEQIANRLNDALHILITAAPLFEASTNHTIKGRFHNELAIVLKDLGAIENRTDYIDRALIEFSAASIHFEQGNHARYQACVENNLGFLFGMIRKFAEAHEHLDRAQALFTRLKDRVHLAQVEDTRARVMLAEGDITKAANLAKSAVRMLEKGDQPSLLSEALTTYGTALARLGDHQHARTVFERAIMIAEQAGDSDSAGIAALTLFEQLAEQLSDDDICQTLERAHNFLKNNKNAATRNRLTDCAFRALSLVHTFRPDWSSFSLVQTLNRHKARYIQQALEDAGGNKSQATRLLGLTGHTNLLYMLKKFHIELSSTPTTVAEQEPVPIASPSPDTEPGTHKPQTVRILHVEDNATIAGLVRELAEQEGWEIDRCDDAEAALTKLRSVVHYDLLLLDYDLPGMNGLQLMESARNMVHRRYVPIVMISGTLDERAAREAGADAFLHKPQEFGLLVQTITRLLDPEQDQEL